MPGSERTVTDVHLDTFGRRSEPRIFPVVNRAGSIGRKMRKPSSIHHSFKNSGRTVAKQMRTINQHDTGIAPVGREDVLCTLLNERRNSFRAGLCCRIRIDQDFVSASQTLALRKRKYFQLTKINRVDFHLDFPRRGSRGLISLYDLPFNSPAHFDAPAERQRWA